MRINPQSTKLQSHPQHIYSIPYAYIKLHKFKTQIFSAIENISSNSRLFDMCCVFQSVKGCFASRSLVEFIFWGVLTFFLSQMEKEEKCKLSVKRL